jgi:hypothetical protein
MQSMPLAMGEIVPPSRCQVAESPPTIASAPDCKACTTTATTIREGPAASRSLIVFNALGPAVRPGRVADYRRSESRCEACRVILSELTAHCAFLNHEAPEDHDLVEILYVKFLGIWRIQLVPRAPEASHRPAYKSHLDLIRCVGPPGAEASRPSLLENEVPSIPIDESRIDFDRTKKWKSHCDANH